MYTYMHGGLLPLNLTYAPGFVFDLIPILIIVAIGVTLLKGYALWHAARNNHVWWFVALLVINTLGILELVYLIWFLPKNKGTLNSHADPSAEGSQKQ